MFRILGKTHLAIAFTTSGISVVILLARTSGAKGEGINQQILEALETTGALRVRVGEVSLALGSSSATNNERHDE
jgi:hypothetical protein